MMNSEQLERAELNSALFDGENLPENIEDLTLDNFVIEDYDPYPIIKGKVAV